MSGAWEWLPVAIAPTLTYLYRHDYLNAGISGPAIYLIAGLLTLAGYLLRHRWHPVGFQNLWGAKSKSCRLCTPQVRRRAR
jgi:hypothetical protein